MPLNIEDEGRTGAPEPPPAEPPAPPPDDSGRGGVWKLLLWIFLIAVAASAVFLMIQFGIIPTGGRNDAPVTTTDQPRPAGADTTAVAATGRAGQAATPAGAAPPDGGSSKDTPRREMAGQLSRRPPALEGEFTIIIAAFGSEADATELAGRWDRAGYRAFVQRTAGWYRVALGRYRTVGEARDEGERLRQALEEGYWIARAEL